MTLVNRTNETCILLKTEAVNSGRLSLREATKVYKIPKSTISDKKDDVRKKLVKTMPRK